MNERIKKLAEQAGAFVSLTDEHYGKLILSGDDVIEKFAELIIRECAEVAYKRSVHSGPSDIFKHFGVEE